MTTYIALASGQMVANVPPLLHVVPPGGHVWWVWTESEHARVPAVRRLLSRRGIESHEFSAPLPTHPADVAAWWQNAARELDEATAEDGADVVLVGNGGTKLLAQAVSQALGPRLREVVYGEGEPVSVMHLRGGLALEASRRPFSGRAIRLEEVLGCSGHMLDDAEAECLWQSGAPVPTLADPHPIFADHAAFRAAYEQANWMLLRRHDEKLADDDEDPEEDLQYADVVELLRGAEHEQQQWRLWRQKADLALAELLLVNVTKSEGDHAQRTPSDDAAKQLRRWRRASLQLARQVRREERLDPESRQRLHDKLEQLRAALDLAQPGGLHAALFDAAIKLQLLARRAHAGHGGPLAHLGNLFEEAVASRVLAAFARSAHWQAVVSEVWRRVKVFPKHEMARRNSSAVAEWDLLFVLKNGVLLNVECKSGKARRKDVDARSHVMHRGASALAEMWVCSPLPTGLAQERWFLKLHALRVQTQAQGLVHLAYDLPGQRARYTVGRDTHEARPLEAELQERVRRYLPS